MRILLDTHTLLWWLEGGGMLAAPAGDLITDPATTVAVSVASVWEIEIKRALGKLDAPDDLLDEIVASRFDLLAISGQHAVTAGRLPRHHDDPFDRLLIGQAISEGLAIVTRDERFEAYAVSIVAA